MPKLNLFILIFLLSGCGYTNPLKVDVNLEGPGHGLNYVLTNISNRDVEVEMWSCSTWENWVVEVQGAKSKIGPGCDKNFPMVKIIPVGKSITGPMGINLSEFDGEFVTVRAGFKYKNQIIWSNRIKIEVSE